MDQPIWSDMSDAGSYVSLLPGSSTKPRGTDKSYTELYEKLFVKTFKKLDKKGEWTSFWRLCVDNVQTYGLEELSRHVDCCYGSELFIVCPTCEAFGVKRYLQTIRNLKINEATLGDLEKDIRSEFIRDSLGSKISITGIVSPTHNSILKAVQHLQLMVLEVPGFSNPVFRERMNIDQSQATILFQFEHDALSDQIIGYCLTGDARVNECLIDHSTRVHRPILIISNLNGADFTKALMGVERLIKNSRARLLNLTGQIPQAQELNVKRFIKAALKPFL